jgi:hypothetical protein
MELILNLAWLGLAAAILGLWPPFGRRAGVSGGKQMVALAVLTLILFPVVSATDDLLAAQNPAEADCCQRKDHAAASAHSMVPAVASPPQPAFAGLSFSFLRLATPGTLDAPAVDHPGLAAVQNRPPPAA